MSEGRGRIQAVDDVRFDLGLYTVPEAARLAGVPSRTLTNWVRGYRYPVDGGLAKARPVIRPPIRDALSFVNLMEALALAGYREAGVPMQRVRKALSFAARLMDEVHILASERLLTDGKELFWEYQERSRDGGADLVNLSRQGQKVFPEAVARYLQQVEWAPDRFALRWWPGSESGEGPVVIDPRRAFGAPVIAGTGIRTEDLFSRFRAGEPIEELANDYGVTLGDVEAAIRIEAGFLEAAAA
jgi:uncharacterized protein (DUF433 family)